VVRHDPTPPPGLALTACGARQGYAFRPEANRQARERSALCSCSKYCNYNSVIKEEEERREERVLSVGLEEMVDYLFSMR